MGEETIISRIQFWCRNQRLAMLNYLLKKEGFDFGPYYMDELIKMYELHKNKINRNKD